MAGRRAVFLVAVLLFGMATAAANDVPKEKVTTGKAKISELEGTEPEVLAVVQRVKVCVFFVF